MDPSLGLRESPVEIEISQNVSSCCLSDSLCIEEFKSETRGGNSERERERERERREREREREREGEREGRQGKENPTHPSQAPPAPDRTGTNQGPAVVRLVSFSLSSFPSSH